MKRTLADWAPVICAAAAALLFCIYYIALEMRMGSLAEVSREQGKILWGSSSFVLNLAMIWCASVSSLAIHQFSDSFKRRQLVIIFVALGLFLVGFIVAIYGGEIAGSAGSELLRNIAERGTRSVFTIVNLNNATATLIAALFVLAFVFVTRGTEDASAQSLAVRIHWFNLLLYSGGVVLATAVYEIYWLFQWGASLDPRRASLQSLASSVAVGGGLIFSSLLMLTVVPPAIRLNRRLAALMSETAANISDFDPEKWLLRQGIGPTPLRSLTAYIAVLLPVATGLLTKLPGWEHVSP